MLSYTAAGPVTVMVLCIVGLVDQAYFISNITYPWLGLQSTSCSLHRYNMWHLVQMAGSLRAISH